jgi:hypothetical protein
METMGGFAKRATYWPGNIQALKLFPILSRRKIKRMKNWHEKSASFAVRI